MADLLNPYSRRPLQPCASPNGIARLLVLNSTLHRRYTISCTLQVGNGVLSRLRSRTFR
jgi:hypothetical protein